jgi:hypothetical protein
MPPVESQGRFEQAVYWAAVGFDRYGMPTYDSPVELTVRWNDKQDETLDAKGNTILTDVEVIVSQNLVPGSLMRLGLLDETPDPPDQLKQVVGFNSTKDVRGRETFRSAKLARASDGTINSVGTGT